MVNHHTGGLESDFVGVFPKGLVNHHTGGLENNCKVRLA